MTTISAVPVVHAGALELELDADRGVFHLVCARSGRRIASDLECAANLERQVVRSGGSRAVWRPLGAKDGGGIEIEFNVGQELQLGLVARADGNTGGLVLTIRVTNIGPPCLIHDAAVLSTGDIGVLDFCPDVTGSSFLTNGWQSWDEIRTLTGGAEASVPEGVTSALAAGLAHSRSGSLILGFSGVTSHFGSVRFSAKNGKPQLEAVLDADHAILSTGASLVSDSLWLSYSDMPALELLNYQRFRGSSPSSSLPVIWDSWHVNYEDTTEKDIIESLEAIRGHFPEIDTVMVGDGYQKIHADGPGIGDWLETNPRFPHGLAWIADQIRRRGLRPGIWTAPFLVGEKCQFYKYYPDSLIRNRTDSQADWREMWRGDRVYYLDTTHPDGRNFLRDIFEQLSYRFGFQAFDVDFTYAAAADGFRRDPSATRADALDRAIALIRRTIGEDRLLMLSGAPIGAGRGGADIVRSTPDAGPNWDARCGARAVIRTALGRSFLGGNPLLAPAAVVGSGEPGLTETEFRALATAVGLSGGPVTLSGPLAALSTDRASILRRILPAGGRTALAVDLFQRDEPQVYAVPLAHAGQASWIVGVFNTSDQPASRSVSLSRLSSAPGSYHVYELWGHRYLGVEADTIPLGELPPRTCSLLAIHPDRAEPQFLAIDEHVLQSSDIVRRVHWDGSRGNGRLEVELSRAGASQMHVHFVVPESLIARSANARTGHARLNRQKSSGRLLTVETAFRDHCSFEIIF